MHQSAAYTCTLYVIRLFWLLTALSTPLAAKSGGMQPLCTIYSAGTHIARWYKTLPASATAFFKLPCIQLPLNVDLTVHVQSTTSVVRTVSLLQLGTAIFKRLDLRKKGDGYKMRGSMVLKVPSLLFLAELEDAAAPTSSDPQMMAFKGIERQ